jgi:hypothetical protein
VFKLYFGRHVQNAAFEELKRGSLITPATKHSNYTAYKAYLTKELPKIYELRSSAITK